MATIKPNLTDKLSLQADTLGGPGPIAFDPTAVEALNLKRSEIVDYIRLRLGDQMVDVELDQEHYDLAIKQALIKYRQRSASSVEESYAFLELQPEVQEYILPSEIMQVSQIYRRGIGSVTGTTASQFEPFAAGFINTYMLVAGRVGGLANYELFTGYQELAMKMFGGYMAFLWNPVTHKLTLQRKIPGNGEATETIMLRIYNYKPDQMLLNDYMSFPWIQDYAYSFAKFTLGEARSKFATIAGPGGGTTLNGATLKQEATAEMDKLEKDLITYTDGANPLTWCVG